MNSVVEYGISCWENRIARSDTFAGSELSHENRQVWMQLVRHHTKPSPVIDKLFDAANLTTDQFLAAQERGNARRTAKLREKLAGIFAQLRKACSEAGPSRGERNLGD